MPAERELWSRLGAADRRHAIVVARATADLLGARTDRAVMAAALVHDIGKLESGLGTFGRVAATVALRWRGRKRIPPPSRFGRYARHDEIGAQMLLAAGSDPLTVAWAREHHLPQGDWTLPIVVASALKAADDD